MVTHGVFLDAGTLGENLDFSSIRNTLDHWDFYDKTPAALTLERIQTAHVVVTNKVQITHDVIQNASALKCIAVAATGYDHIDIQAAKARGIVVCNVKAYATASVIQHAIGMLINLFSKLSDYQNAVNKGEWINSPYFCLHQFQTRELGGKVLGIVGNGAIGQGVAQVARALGMTVLIANRAHWQAILPQVDVLSLHCPLTAQTQKMIDASVLQKMKKGAMLLNVSRGGLIDELALKQALVSGHLAGAALDVLQQEPPQADDLLAAPIPNLIITPHVAWASQEARARLVQEISLNIKAFLTNQPRNQVA